VTPLYLVVNTQGRHSTRYFVYRTQEQAWNKMSALVVRDAVGHEVEYDSVENGMMLYSARWGDGYSATVHKVELEGWL
jgi:hypothetical protein